MITPDRQSSEYYPGDNGNYREYLKEGVFQSRYKEVGLDPLEKKIVVQIETKPDSDLRHLSGVSELKNKIVGSHKDSQGNNLIITLNNSTLQSLPNSNGTENLSPTRFAPLVSDLAMLGAACVMIIYSSRYLYKIIQESLEPKKEQKQTLTLYDVRNKLSPIGGENFVLSDKKFKLQFTSLSSELKEEIINFFSNKESFDFQENPNSKKLTLQLKKGFSPEKIKDFIPTLIAFGDRFGDKLNAEKKRIEEEKDKEVINQERELRVRELKTLMADKLSSIERDISEINQSLSLSELNQNKIKKKFDKILKDIALVDRYNDEFVNKFDIISLDSEKIKDVKRSFEAIKISNVSRDSDEDQIPKQPHTEVGLDSNESFKKYRPFTTKTHEEGQVVSTKPYEGEIVSIVQHPVKSDIEEAVQPSSSIELVNMSDLENLRTFFLGEIQINLTSKIIREKRDDKLMHYQMGFANSFSEEILSGVEKEFYSKESYESFEIFAAKFPEKREKSNIAVAKNYFHNLLDETVDKIYDKHTIGIKDESLKTEIKNGVYFFLNFAMNDKEAMLNAYKEGEVLGYSRAGVSGRGHASKAPIEDIKKLCYCLKLFGNQLENVDYKELKDFFSYSFFKNNSIDPGPATIVSNTFDTTCKKDDIFVKDLIAELNSEKKVKGIDLAKDILIEFVKYNLTDSLREKYSIEKTSIDDEKFLKVLHEKPDLVDEIVKLSNDKDSIYSFAQFKEKLAEVFENERQKIYKRELEKQRLRLI